MRVLFIKQDLDRTELDMVLKLHRQGVFIRVLARPGSLGSKELEAEGIFIASKNYRTKISWPVISQIRGLIKYLKFNILHCPETRGLSNAIFASYFTPVKIIGYRGTPAKVRHSDPGSWLGLLHPRVNKIICVNQSIYDYMKTRVPKQKLMLNYKGYDTAWNDYEGVNKVPMPACVQDPNAFVVMYLALTKGRPHKGLEVLVDAMHLVNNPRAHLVFIGDYDDSTRSAGETGPANARIHFVGELEYAAQYLAEADAFVLPSTRDGFPRAMKEALAAALPIICTDIPGPRELVIDGETGLLVEPNSPKALAKAIDHLADNPALSKEFGERGQQLLKNKFSTQAFTDKTLALYKVLAG